MRSLLLCFLLLGCASQPPVGEYSLARTALEAARDQDAARYAPSFWHSSEEAYQKGEVFFRAGDYKEAETQFAISREFAEKAENATRILKYKSGDLSQ